MGRDDHFATALASWVDTRLGQLTLASAGHPPPLLISGGQVSLVAVVPGPPKGVTGPAVEATTIAFQRGATLLAFIDGLVENRTGDVDSGLRRLIDAASSAPVDLEGMVDHVLAQLVGSDHEDDIALLAIRFVG
jgi:serine phosphatase RsbU (regulator of sigma subunit)